MKVIKVKKQDTKPIDLPADSRTVKQMNRRVQGYVSKVYNLTSEIKKYLMMQTNAETRIVSDATDESLDKILRELSKLEKNFR